jgi:hypothetical protein
VFKKYINNDFLQLNKCFKCNLLLLILEKNLFLQFLTTNSSAIHLHISYENRQISRIHSTIILGWLDDENLSWHCHIDQMIPKLNKATNVIRNLKPLLSLEALKKVYFSTVHSII